MVQGDQWLEGIAKGMRGAIANGAAPTPEQLTVRQFVNHFGYARRGDRINSQIRNGLERHSLSTDPDFAVGWIDSTIVIRLDSDAPGALKPYATSDPTHRIRSLEAANNEPQSVTPEDPLQAATTIMLLNDYSQLPVMTGKRNVSGIVSWESIGAHLSLGQACECVRDCMDAAKELPDTAPLFDAIATIAAHGYVLVRSADKTITGIVTASDLSLQFMQLAGPFLFVGEIEGHLRHLIHGTFTLEQLREAAASEAGRSIEGSGDLTIGDYHALLRNKDNWDQLSLNIDRAAFVQHLNEVRQIRNGVMHFNPDGLSENDTKKLRDLARFFEKLARIGVV